MKFDYYAYPNSVSIKQSVRILDGGLTLKAESSSATTDDSGATVEYSLAEKQDDLVNLVYSEPIPFSVISNQNHSNLNARVRGQQVGNDIANVSYNEESHTASINFDKNIGTGASTEQLVPISVIPAHRLIGVTETKVVGIQLTSISIVSKTVGMFTVNFSPVSSTTFPGTVFSQVSIGIELSANLLGTGIVGLDGKYKVIEAISDGNDPANSVSFILQDVNFLTSTTLLGIVPVTGTISTIQYNLGTTPKASLPLYHLCGLWGSESLAPGNFQSKPSNNPGYLSKKRFSQYIHDLSTQINQRGLDVVAIPLMEKLIKLDIIPTGTDMGPWIVKETDADGNDQYYRDQNYSYLKRRYYTGSDSSISTAELVNPLSTLAFAAFSLFDDDYRNATFADATLASKNFIPYQQSKGNLLPVTNPNPFMSSLEQVIIGRLGTRDELFDEIRGIEDDIINYLNSNFLADMDFSADDFISNFKLIYHNRATDGVQAMRGQIYAGLALAIAATIVGGAAGILFIAFAKKLETYVDQIDSLIGKIGSYEYYTGQSVIGNGRSINELNDPNGGNPLSHQLVDRELYKIPASILIPVDFGSKKVKYQTKDSSGKLITKTRKKDMGIRWVQVNFVNAFVYDMYRKSEVISGTQINTNWNIISVSQGDGIAVQLPDPSSTQAQTPTQYPTTIVVAPQSDADVGTTIYLQLYDSSSGTKSALAGMWKCSVISNTEIMFNADSLATFTLANLSIPRIIKPYPVTQPAKDPVSCQISYSVPYLPTDSALRDYVFSQYGQFDQSALAVRWSDWNKIQAAGITNDMSETDLAEALNKLQTSNPTIPGFEIFHKSSKSIADLRSGIDLYPKVQFLLAVLNDTFGTSRVSLIETTRSYDDQEVLQLGGANSNFLSWHNYGLAVKINITGKDGVTLIRDGSDDFFTLLNIAEAFSSCAYNGDFGNPCNVVWCGRLVVGPNLFVWEFLPIGVGHKDSVKFRDASFNQMDPIEVCSYVDSTKYLKHGSYRLARLVVPNNEEDLNNVLSSTIATITAPSNDVQNLIDSANLLIRQQSNFPIEFRMKEKTLLLKQLFTKTKAKETYITDISSGYKNGVQIDGDIWVSPAAIANYPLHKSLILKDIQEFMFTVRRKMDANGKSLMDGQRVIDWKNMNPVSFVQMVEFNTMIGQYATSRALLASDYLDTFANLTVSANNDPVGFVRNFLGLNNYMTVAIYPDGMERDSGYITLFDGKFNIEVMQARSAQPEGNGNMFGEQQIDATSVEFGQISKGVFFSANDYPMDVIKSSAPVIAGFNPDGTIAVPPSTLVGDAYLLHIIIKDNIISLLDTVSGMFENLKADFMHDSYSNSPNAGKLTDNEFGIIASQDVMSFSDLKDVYSMITLNNKAGYDPYGNQRGAGLNSNNTGVNQSVYESLISTIQMTGVQFSRNTKEKPTITPLNNQKLENVLKIIGGDNSPDVRDIL